MRVATMIIALVLMLVVGAQSCTVMVGGEMTGDEGIAEGGAVGILLTLMFLIGAAFSMAKPMVSVISFAIAAVLEFAAGATTDFSDMSVWGGVAAVLAVMSFFGHRGLKKE